MTISSEPPRESRNAIMAGGEIMGYVTSRGYRENLCPQSYLTATLTVNVSLPPGGTKCRPLLCSGAFAGPIQGSTQ